MTRKIKKRITNKINYMKNKDNLQRPARTNDLAIENSFFSEQSNGVYNASTLYSLNKQIPLHELLHAITDIDLFTKMSNDTTKPLPTMETVTFNDDPQEKINGNEVALCLFFNVFIKETAIRLSQLEMAISNYDLSGLQLATHTLKALFSNMRIPAASLLTGQMEELAKQNKLQEVNDLLPQFKKIIAQVMQPGSN